MAAEKPIIVIEWEGTLGEPFTNAFGDTDRDTKYQNFMDELCEELMDEEMPRIDKLLENNAGLFNFVLREQITTTDDAIAWLQA